MGRRSAGRRIEGFVLFDVLYEGWEPHLEPQVPGSELGGVDRDLRAKTYIEASDRQIKRTADEVSKAD
jgi:hypothetical protein